MLILLVILIFNFISVGFYTLLEQKILGYMNNRLGPNKIFILGFIQFMSDFLKLIFKDNIYLMIMNNYSFNLFIYLFFSLSLFMWILLPLFHNLYNFFFFIILMLILIHKILIFILIMWSLNSFYSIISLIRLIIQNLSFEILFMMKIFFYFNI